MKKVIVFSLLLLFTFTTNAQIEEEKNNSEIFEIVEEVQGNKKIENLRPLYFTLPIEILNDMDPVESVTPEDNQDYVAHYFDLSLDEEITPSTLCEYDPVNTKLGVFADERTIICQDILNEKKKKIFNVYEPGTQDTPGEIC